MTEYRFKYVCGQNPTEKYIRSLGGDPGRYIRATPGGDPSQAGIGCGWIGET